MNNAKHYFKSAWNDEFRCAQCGEYITAERHIRASKVGLEEWRKTLDPLHSSKAK